MSLNFFHHHEQIIRHSYHINDPELLVVMVVVSMRPGAGVQQVLTQGCELSGG